VLRIRDIFLVRIRIWGSVPLTNGSALRNEEVRKKADLETQMPVLTPENITARQESSHALCMKRGGADRSRQARAGQAHRRRVSFLVVRPGQARSTIPPTGDQRGTAGNSARAGRRAQENSAGKTHRQTLLHHRGNCESGSQHSREGTQIMGNSTLEWAVRRASLIPEPRRITAASQPARVRARGDLGAAHRHDAERSQFISPASVLVPVRLPSQHVAEAGD
jgi:hypothetical protein